jgi:hypothetical protein
LLRRSRDTVNALVAVEESTRIVADTENAQDAGIRGVRCVRVIILALLNDFFRVLKNLRKTRSAAS